MKKTLYFNDLDPVIRNNFKFLDYKSRKYPLEINQNGVICFKSNKLLSRIFLRSDLDYLWDDLKKGLINKDELMELYRLCGYSLEGFIEIFCQEE